MEVASERRAEVQLIGILSHPPSVFFTSKFFMWQRLIADERIVRRSVTWN